MVRIAIIGPECSGKTTLAQALAAQFNEPWVPEYAREYLTENGPEYLPSDLLHIAKGQLLWEAEAQQRANKLLFCDTDTLTTYLWGMEKYGKVDPILEQMMRDVVYHHSFLCTPEMPWEPDPLRESPTDRERLFEVYKGTLDEQGWSYTVLIGAHEQRMKLAIKQIDEVINSSIHK